MCITSIAVSRCTRVVDGDPRLEAVAELTRRIAVCEEPDAAIDAALEALDELFGLSHAMLLSFDERTHRLDTIATQGYEPGSIGSEVSLAPGEGILGIAVAQACPLRIGNLQRLLLYGRTVRRGQVQTGARVPDELPLPGLPAAESQLAVPVMRHGQVTGVLMVESTEVSAFDAGHEAILEVVTALIADVLELERLAAGGADDGQVSTPSDPQRVPDTPGSAPSGPEGARVQVRFYPTDGSAFLDGEYLAKGVPGRLLWKLLNDAAGGRTDFTNREVRLDPALELPAYKDNFESRLILLRRRLDEHQAPFRIVKTGRGRFRFTVAHPVELVDAGAETHSYVTHAGP